MTRTDRDLLNARIGELLHAILVRIRYYTYPSPPGEPDLREEINDLADLAHNLPRYIVGHDEFAVSSAEELREALVEHVRRFFPDVDPAQHHYVRLLDLDAGTFLARHRDHQWDTPDPVAAAG
ncbi:MAG: hypothetical protein K2X87_13570 [Gemmataceae bacterium]|nr:hypothetical protein [Gemmataceae bacterium]